MRVEVIIMDLYVKTYLVKEEQKRLFIVHGICEHSGRYSEFAKKLNESKISVITYDLRGHGKSPGKKGYIKNFTDHLEDLQALIEKYYQKDVENILLGHSMGALIGHLYLLDNPKVSRYISSGAPTDFLPQVKLFKYLPYQPLGFIKLKNNFANGTLSNDKKVEEDYENDPLVLKKYYLKLAGEMFVRGVKYFQKNINKQQTTTLFLHGEEDKIVPKEMSENSFRKLNNPHNKLIIYPKMQHEILNEIEKEKVIADIVGWIYG
jgi:alpha-beta hydrolase superfamily lysophospholipase